MKLNAPKNSPEGKLSRDAETRAARSCPEVRDDRAKILTKTMEVDQVGPATPRGTTVPLGTGLTWSVLRLLADVACVRSPRTSM